MSFQGCPSASFATSYSRSPPRRSARVTRREEEGGKTHAADVDEVCTAPEKLRDLVAPPRCLLPFAVDGVLSDLGDAVDSWLGP